MKNSFAEIVTIEVARLFIPLERLNSPRNIAAFINELGWRFPAHELNLDLEELLGRVASLKNSLAQLSGSEDSETRIRIYADLMEEVKSTIQTIDELAPEIKNAIENLPGLQGQVLDSAEILPRRILDYLLFTHLQVYHPRIFSILHLAGIMETVKDSSDMPIRTVHWVRIPELLCDPPAVAHKVYNWDSSENDISGNKLLTRLEILTRAFLLPGGLYQQSATISSYFNRSEDDNAEVRIPLYQRGHWPDSYYELCLNICPVPAAGAGKSGLAIYPGFYPDQFDLANDLSGQWSINVKGSCQLEREALCLEIRPPHNLKLLTGITENPTEIFNGAIEVELAKVSPPDADKLSYIFGAHNGSFAGFKDISLHLMILKSKEKEEISAELELNDFTFALDISDGDGFVKKILADLELKSVNNLGVGWSNLDGLYFRGSSDLSVTLPSAIDLGPALLESTTIGFNLEGDSCDVILSVSLSAEIGPVAARISRLGLLLPISFPGDGNGNFGPAQVGPLAFLPPAGAGFALDLSALSGGGHLDYNPEQERYAGILSLSFQKIGLTAIALVTTKMPNGAPGCAILINISVAFHPPIQLFMGFTLMAVGGMVGINRTMQTEVLQEGIRNRTLDSILFPDPEVVLLNADQMISDMSRVFPPAEGRYIIGPMLKIGWGSPTVITADIGVFIEFPEPIRIALIGQIQALLPKPEAPLIILKIDILGVIEVEKGEITFQGCLHDSKILTYSVVGDSAFLYRWKGSPEFALAVGGFHPGFTVPEPTRLFGGLRPISMNISPSNRFSIVCSSYQALTPNTLQFGANATLSASLGSVTLAGSFSFDALIYFSPFSFAVGITGIFLISYRGRKLSNVGIFINLSGPRPWSANGKAIIGIFIWEVEVKFNETWGSSGPVALPPQDPIYALQDALEQESNWGSALSETFNMAETLREIEDDSLFLVHPSGNIEVRQNLMPLGIKLDKYGNAPIEGHNQFDIESIEICAGGNGLSRENLAYSTLQEYYARGQIKELSAQEKMSLPSFEKMDAGAVTLPSASISFAGKRTNDDGPIDQISVDYDYETILIKPDLITEKVDRDLKFLKGKYANIFIRQAAVNKCPFGKKAKQKFSKTETVSKVALHEEEYVIVRRDNLARGEISSGEKQSRVKADMALQKLDADQIFKSEKYKVVLRHEASLSSR